MWIPYARALPYRELCQMPLLESSITFLKQFIGRSSVSGLLTLCLLASARQHPLCSFHDCSIHVGSRLQSAAACGNVLASALRWYKACIILETRRIAFSSTTTLSSSMLCTFPSAESAAQMMVRHRHNSGSVTVQRVSCPSQCLFVRSIFTINRSYCTTSPSQALCARKAFLAYSHAIMKSSRHHR